MRRRSCNMTPPQPLKHHRPSLNGGSLEIKDAKDGALTRCGNNSCREVAPICFALVSKKCTRNGVTPRWYHISLGEHYCSACYDEISRGNNGLSQDYRRWVSAWTGNSKSQPSHRLFIAEEILPYWLQCINCQKWRCLSKEIEIDSNIIAEFTCSSQNLIADNVKNCSVPEDPRVKQIKDIKWMETLAVPPLLKHSPAAKFLNDEYFMDGVGMSPSTKKLDNDLIKFDPVITEIMQPFYQPHENGKALCIRPDVMEYDEVLEFPEYSREHVLYLGLRNLIIALWNMNPKQWLTPEFCLEHLICRGMVRILCAKELLRILRFLNQKGVVNYGILHNPPYLLLGSEAGSVKKLKVVVVGAGMAGLAAARQLQNFGAQVTVLEARARLGGRIWDDFSLGVVVGRGAQLVTGIVNNPITLMCLQGGIKFKKLGEECPLITAKYGTLVPMKTDKRVDFHFNAMLDAVEDWRRQAKRDETLQSTLDIMNRLFLDQAKITLTPAEEQLLNFHLSNLEYSCGAPLSDVSSLNWDQNEHFAQFAGEHALMADGYSSIIDRLADGIDIRTEFEATKIDYSGPNVKVYGKHGKPLICNKVLVTLPLSVLQWETVEFNPPLPAEKKRAISALGAGIIEKVALKFPTKFWQTINGADYFGNVPDSDDVKNQFSIFYDFSAKNPLTNETSYVLMSYLSGNAAKLVRIKSDEEIIEMALNSLRKLFSNKEIPEPDNYLVTHWWEDPCSGMSYSYVKVGSSGTDYDIMADEIAEKVYFAGEATNRHFPQTVAGAYLSGVREAAKIVSDCM